MFSKTDKLCNEFSNEKPPFIVSTIFAVDVEKYETMVLYEDKSEIGDTKYVLAERYETSEEAEKGHKTVIKNLLAGKKYSGKDELFDKMNLKKTVEVTQKAMICSALKKMIKNNKEV